MASGTSTTKQHGDEPGGSLSEKQGGLDRQESFAQFERIRRETSVIQQSFTGLAEDSLPNRRNLNDALARLERIKREISELEQSGEVEEELQRFAIDVADLELFLKDLIELVADQEECIDRIEHDTSPVEPIVVNRGDAVIERAVVLRQRKKCIIS